MGPGGRVRWVVGGLWNIVGLLPYGERFGIPHLKHS
jgi:hypothetical protein